MPKHYLDEDVYTSAVARVRKILREFPKYYVSFSGGKDSGVMLNLVLQVAREEGRLPVPTLVVDLEAQYKSTVDYVRSMLERPDVEPYWVCLPLHLRNSVSQYQPHWLCWDPKASDRWVRDLPDHPGVISDEGYFPFFRRGMEFEEFVPLFGEWFSEGERTACFVGIRSDESLNRFRTIRNERKVPWDGQPWTTLVSDERPLYNAYPIYDWQTRDIWIANGKFKWPYNRVYDLMHLAGLSIHQMRLCQPYGDDQRKGLWLFKILEPETWDKVLERVEGANFGNRYVAKNGTVLGYRSVDLPKGHTYRSYTEFLLQTMPPYVAAHYQSKINTFLTWWAAHGWAEIPDEADLDLEAKRKVPSWRRICKVILKNDYWCKGLSFSQTKREMERQLALAARFLA